MALLLAACTTDTPPCSYGGAGDHAPSAGCFNIEDGALLLVQGLNGKVSLPGGLSLPGEVAQCTAFRETWEETGLELRPGELLQVFDTGFHLYRCERDSASGSIDPPPRLEVRRAFYLESERFYEYEWRFERQGILLHEMMLAQP